MLSPRFLQMECNLPASTGNNPTSSSGSTSKPDNKNKMEKKKISKGVKLSTDPQSVAARERRHRISDRFKILQSMVPGGNKMDTVSMLEEAIHYVKFLKTQIWLHQTMINFVDEDQSPSMFLPQDYNVPSQDTTNYFQQQNPLVEANSGGDPLQSLPVLAQSCFQGEDITPSFEANVKYWPA